jgi:hypothetical protein
MSSDEEQELHYGIETELDDSLSDTKPDNDESIESKSKTSKSKEDDFKKLFGSDNELSESNDDNDNDPLDDLMNLIEMDNENENEDENNKTSDLQRKKILIKKGDSTTETTKKVS